MAKKVMEGKEPVGARLAAGKTAKAKQEAGQKKLTEGKKEHS